MDIIRQIEVKKRMKRVRGMIPISVIDANIHRIIRELFIESYWNLSDNRAKMWLQLRSKPREFFDETIH
jgi:hypothetical protein